MGFFLKKKQTKNKNHITLCSFKTRGHVLYGLHIYKRDCIIIVKTTVLKLTFAIELCWYSSGQRKFVLETCYFHVQSGNWSTDSERENIQDYLHLHIYEINKWHEICRFCCVYIDAWIYLVSYTVIWFLINFTYVIKLTTEIDMVSNGSVLVHILYEIIYSDCYL